MDNLTVAHAEHKLLESKLPSVVDLRMDSFHKGLDLPDMGLIKYVRARSLS